MRISNGTHNQTCYARNHKFYGFDIINLILIAREFQYILEILEKILVELVFKRFLFEIQIMSSQDNVITILH